MAQPSGAPPASRSPADELRSLSRVTWAAVLELAADLLGAAAAVAILSALFTAGLGFAPGLSIAPSGPTAAQVQAMTTSFGYVTTLIPPVLVLELVAFALLWTGFRGLSRAGAREFSLPSKLTLVGAVGLALMIPGLVVYFSSLSLLMASLGPGGASAAGAIVPFLAGLALVLIAAVLEVVGMIGGQILGLWKVGGRYGQTTLKVGAILTIVPFISIVAPILIIIGVRDAKQRALQPQPTSR